MSAGGYCLDEIYLTNESFAFYTATNTFRNPIFDGLNVAHEASPKRSSMERASPVPEESHSKRNKVDAKNGGQQRRQWPGGNFSPATSKLPLIGQTRQRCAEICDNWALTARDKLFVMETNFKRRMRILRRFLGKNLPPWLLPAAGKTRHQDEQFRRAQSVRSGAEANLSELLREERNLCGDRRWEAANKLSGKRGGHQLFNLSEPISAKALGAQQERILSRLERIRSDNQKWSSGGLFQSRPASWLAGRGAAAESSSVGGQAAEDDAEDDAAAADDAEDRARRVTGWRHAARLPKSASSPGSQVTIPFWLVRSTRDEDSSTASSSTASCGGSSTSSTSNEASLAETAKATSPKTGTTTSRSGPLARCAEATTGLISSVQGQTKKKETEQKKTCIVCYERSPNIVTLPCEHSDVCSDCFIEIIYVAVKNSQYPLRCVLCRAKVERIRCSRRLMLSVIKRNRTKNTKFGLLSF